MHCIAYVCVTDSVLTCSLSTLLDVQWESGGQLQQLRHVFALLCLCMLSVQLRQPSISSKGSAAHLSAELLWTCSSFCCPQTQCRDAC